MIGAPSLAVLGAYFPAWMLCVAFGVAGAVLLRPLLRPLLRELSVPLAFVAYLSVAVMAALSVWLIWQRA